MNIMKEELDEQYLDEKYRYITEDQKCRQFTAYGFVVNDDEEIKQYSL